MVTLILVAAVVAPRGEPVAMTARDPRGVEARVPMCRILVAPAPVGITGLVSKLHVTPVGNGVTQDKVTA
jgi:hypothetical protein